MRLDPLQAPEVFHLAFLRALARSVPLSTFVLKGGSNLRFFFGSIRYSADMDLDTSGLPVHVLRDRVMAILVSPALGDTLRTFGIERVVPPSMASAKQTATVQRFKVHLITGAGEDLSTKVEFSGVDSTRRFAQNQSWPRSWRRIVWLHSLPHITPHTATAAARQKLRALASRRRPEARDIFDLYTLSSHPDIATADLGEGFAQAEIREGHERIFSVSYEQYRDTVVAFLGPEDRAAHDSSGVWDEIRLRAVSLLEQGTRDEG